MVDSYAGAYSKNNKYHKIQKQIVQACAEVTTKVIMTELGDSNFSLLVDESRDVSVREQMAVIVRLVICHDCSNSECTYSTLTCLF